MEKGHMSENVSREINLYVKGSLTELSLHCTWLKPIQYILHIYLIINVFILDIILIS